MFYKFTNNFRFFRKCLLPVIIDLVDSSVGTSWKKIIKTIPKFIAILNSEIFLYALIGVLIIGEMGGQMAHR